LVKLIAVRPYSPEEVISMIRPTVACCVLVVMYGCLGADDKPDPIKTRLDDPHGT
jgi:hypothetical protein